MTKRADLSFGAAALADCCARGRAHSAEQARSNDTGHASGRSGKRRNFEHVYDRFASQFGSLDILTRGVTMRQWTIIRYEEQTSGEHNAGRNPERRVPQADGNHSIPARER